MGWNAVRDEDVVGKPPRPHSIGHGSKALLPEQEPLVDSLVKLPHAELTKLAQQLPFDAEAMDALLPRRHRWERYEFNAWIDHRQAMTLAYPEVPDIRLAQYCAAASQYAVAKMMEELLEISRQKLAVVQRMKDISKLAESNKLPELTTAVLRDAGKETSCG